MYICISQMCTTFDINCLLFKCNKLLLLVTIIDVLFSNDLRFPPPCRSDRHRRMPDLGHLYERPLREHRGLFPLRVPARTSHRCGRPRLRGHPHAHHLLRRNKNGHMFASVPQGGDKVGMLLRQPRTRLRRTLPTLPRVQLR